MLQRLVLTAMVFCGFAAWAMAQEATPVGGETAATWRRAATREVSPPAKLDDEVAPPAERVAALTAAPGRSAVTPINGGSFSLPNDAGQIYREYDIMAYTTRVTATKRPEQAIVDWVLRETGYEAWHTGPVAFLTANARTLQAYHTPEMQRKVAELVDRFVSSEAATYTFSLRLATLDSPTWRVAVQHLLRPVPVQTPGINAWVLAKEDAAILLGELRRRDDYREHSSPYLMVNNGQSTVVSTMRNRAYVRDIVTSSTAQTGFEQSQGQVEEGFNLDFSPLLSTDRRMIDAAIKCEIDQVEKMIPLMMEISTKNAQRQRTKIESPQMTHYRFHERFRWPTDQVLLIGLGMVALPIPVDGRPLVPGVPLPVGNTPARADMLIFVECKGQATPNGDPAQTARTPQNKAKNYRGRY